MCGDSAVTGPVTLTFGTKAWTLDLCQAHLNSIAEQIQSIGNHGQVMYSNRVLKALTEGLAPAKRPYRAAEGISMTDVRRWAKEQGIDVHDVGRISQDVIEQYKASHPNPYLRWPDTTG